MGDEEELRECPFCGAPARAYEPSGFTGGQWEIMCSDQCQCDRVSVTADEKHWAARKWNKRPVEDALRAENAALKAQWEAVPWKTLRSICEEAFDATDAVCEVDDWLDANAPKQEPQP